MVAYSFKKRFAEPIRLGTKAQTIRADRKRHARAGEQIQLYVGMRTKHCRLIGEAQFLSVMPVRLIFTAPARARVFELGGEILSPDSMEAFARSDGFADTSEMARFWWDNHEGEGHELAFKGVLIRWQPLLPSELRDIAVAA